jgi:hypothetical protein
VKASRQMIAVVAATTGFTKEASEFAVQ